MDSLKLQLPKISNQDHMPLVDALLTLFAWQQKRVDKLEPRILKQKDVHYCCQLKKTA